MAHVGDELALSAVRRLRHVTRRLQFRRRAPLAFMTQERAVTMADYERVTEMNAQVENSVATLRWTGSWYTVFITAEPECGSTLSSTLRRELRRKGNR